MTRLMTIMRSGARRAGSIFGSMALAGVLAACAGETARSEECLPRDFEAARTADGGMGFLECSLDGSGYLPYDGSNPNVPLDVGPPDVASSEAGSPDGAPVTVCSMAGGAKLGFMCSGCTTDADCQAGLVCFPFPNKTGNTCTRNCTPADQSTVCPAPSEGCGNNGHCKP
jgi:hypothetical protein